jgi:hypothetical protein
MKITNNLEEVSVFERRSEFFRIDNPNISVINAAIQSVDTAGHSLKLDDGRSVIYDKMCLCTGASPNLLVSNIARVVGLRDVETVEALGRKLGMARRVVVVGNGGIALELVHALAGMNIVWIVRDNYLGHSFFDASASAFIMPTLAGRMKAAESVSEEMRCGRGGGPGESGEGMLNEGSSGSSSGDGDGDGGGGARVVGGGVGPEWLKKSKFLQEMRNGKKSKRIDECQDQVEEEKEQQGSLQMEYAQDVYAIREVNDSGAGVWWATGIGASKMLSPSEQVRAEGLFLAHLGAFAPSFPIFVLTSKDKVRELRVISCLDFVYSMYVLVVTYFTYEWNGGVRVGVWV